MHMHIYRYVMNTTHCGFRHTAAVMRSIIFLPETNAISINNIYTMSNFEQRLLTRQSSIDTPWVNLPTVKFKFKFKSFI